MGGVSWPAEVEYVARDWGDWVACTWPDGGAVAYNKQTGRWCRLPHPDCPIVSCISGVEAEGPETATRYTITPKGRAMLEGK